MTETVRLGKIIKGEYAGEKVSLTKHSWDCGWYWGFGYLWNRNLHFHFESLLWFHYGKDGKSYLNPFESVLDDEFYIIADMMKSAYVMNKMAEVYNHGGHYTDKAPRYYCDRELENKMNKDLEKLLSHIWDYVKSIEEKILEREANFTTKA